MASEANKKERTPLQDLKPSMPLEGKVTRLELYGAFVDVGAEHEGLVHISMLKRGPVNRVQDVVEEGQEVQVWVHRVDANAGRLLLSMMRPLQHKWKDLKPGSHLKGKVIRIEDYGVFVDVGAERPGLVHISEMSRDYVVDPNEFVKVGDQVEVNVIDVNRKKRQIRLSMKASALEQEAEVEEPIEESVPTAMELALRSAMKGAKKRTAKPKLDSAEDMASEQDPERRHQDDLLQRTLQHRVRTS